MKTINVTQQTHSAVFGKCKNLGQIIAVIEKQEEANGLYVTKVYLNGRAMDEDEEGLLEGLAIHEIKSLEFNLSTKEEILKNSLMNIIATIQNIQLKSIEFAKEFRRTANVDDEKVKFILIQCREVIQSLELIFATNEKQSFQLKHLSLWSEAEKELTNILQCIFQTRKMTGFEMMSDLLEYDLVQALDQWEEVLEKELIDNSQFTGIFNLNSAPHKRDNEVDA